MANAIDAIYMVEASSKLRVAQKNLLCGEDAPMTESKAGWHSTSKYGGLPIVWTQTIRSIPQGTTTLACCRLPLRASSCSHTHQVTIRRHSSWLTNSSMPFLYMPSKS